MDTTPQKYHRGDIYYANLEPHLGCEQGGIRPVLVVQNNVGNKHSKTLIVSALTSRTATKAKLPTGNKALLSINRTICTALDYAVTIGWRSDNPAHDINPCLMSTTPYFTDFLRDWLKLMKTQVKITTYSAYEKTILHKVIPYFDKHLPKIRLDAVSAKHIQDYYNYELEVNHVSANTVKHRHANIHKAFAYAYKIIRNFCVSAIEPGLPPSSPILASTTRASLWASG